MKNLLLLGSILVLGMAWPTAAADGPQVDAPPVLSGTWDITTIYYFEGTADGLTGKLHNFQQFHADGRTALFLAQNPTLDGGIGDPRTACVGEWKHRTGRSFDVTLYCVWQRSWTDAPPVPDRILMRIELAPDGRTWTASPFYYQVYDGTNYTGMRTPQSWGETVADRLDLVPIP